VKKRHALLGLLGALIVLTPIAGWVAYVQTERAAGEIIRYAEHRLIGHPKLEAVFLPLLAAWRLRVERPITAAVPALGKGQQAESLPPQRYSPAGVPLPTRKEKTRADAVALLPDRLLRSEADIQAALLSAQPGQTLEIAPGNYLMQRSIRIHQAGTADQPIILRARVPGSVTIESSASEGFHLHGPYWIFLVIRGVCPEHSNCEHAFHVVGKAKGIVIRNNRIEDFNAQIKVNGLDQAWPDHGLIQFNTLANTRVRDTAHSVTPVDIVGASGWQVVDNQIRNFIKGDGNKTAYGVFMKGGGEKGRIERNLIVCADQNVSQPGMRVGLSFGGGGTDPGVCRDRRCVTEHSAGLAANNLIAHCNDFGIYINQANQTLVAHNTLINTYGIDARFPAASATIIGNLLDGIIRAREGAALTESSNQRPLIWQVFGAPADLNLNWTTQPIDLANPSGTEDSFCGVRRALPTAAGSMAGPGACEI
jgi:hypothetical protein